MHFMRSIRNAMISALEFKQAIERDAYFASVADGHA
jgi:hypothetical protein